MATILVVDDDVLVRYFGLDVLAEAGFEALGAKHADEAVAILENRHDVRILFTDVHMPGASMDGFALARYVADRWPDIGIIVVSGLASPRPGDMPPGARFHSKPYNSITVLTDVRDLLASRSLGSQRSPI